jgi:hypothetical protein
MGPGPNAMVVSVCWCIECNLGLKSVFGEIFFTILFGLVYPDALNRWLLQTSFAPNACS